MKKLLLFIAAAVVAISAAANDHKPIPNPRVEPQLDKKEVNAKMHDNVGLKRIVADDPAGESVNYQAVAEGVYPSGGYFYCGQPDFEAKVVFADDGKTVSIQGLIATYPDAWLTGTLNDDGTKLTIPVGQSVYYSVFYDADVVLGWGSTTVEGTSLVLTIDPSVEAITFSVDPSTGVMTLDGGEGDISVGGLDAFEGTGLCGYWTDDGSMSLCFWAITLTPVDVKPAVPADPTNVVWNDGGDESGYSNLSYTLPTTDVDGKTLVKSNLYYSIYLDDDQLFTFDAETYTDLTEDMTEIPASFTGYDFYPARVYFYRTLKNDNPFFENRIGIQAIYKVETADGEVVNKSNIVYWELPKPLMLADDANNEAILEENRGTTTDVVISGRTLYKDGYWNTLCLPFALESFTGTPLEGAIVKTLESASFSEGTLTLNFSENSLTSIEAGKPYIVRWEATEGASDITDPVFEGVTIINWTSNVETDVVHFIGSYSPVYVEGENKTMIYVDDKNKLHCPGGAMTINAFRAVFILQGDLECGTGSGINKFVLNYGDDPTGISTPVIVESNDVKSGWFTLDGRQLSGQPATKGVYINNGVKVVKK